jgi:hypothetical protein
VKRRLAPAAVRGFRSEVAVNRTQFTFRIDRAVATRAQQAAIGFLHSGSLGPAAHLAAAAARQAYNPDTGCGITRSLKP